MPVADRREPKIAGCVDGESDAPHANDRQCRPPDADRNIAMATETGLYVIAANDRLT